MSIYNYDHGFPFNKTLALNLDIQHERIFKNKASLIIVDGQVGEGKTTMGVHILDYLNSKSGKEKISLAKKDHPQLAHGGKEFTSKLRICFERMFHVVGYDEAGDFNSRGALSRFNQMLNRTFETYRGFKIVVVLMLPCLKALDKDLFMKGIPRILIHVYDRMPDYGNFKVYSAYRMGFIRRDMEKLVNPQQAYQIHPSNFQGQFLDLEPERSKLLDEISMHGKIEDLKKSEIKIDGLVGYIDIAPKVGRSVVWVKRTVSELHIKHAKVINRAKYFKEDVINTLMDHIDGLDSE